MNEVSTRRRKLSKKGRTYRASLLKERSVKINGRMMRKGSIIKDLLISSKIRIAAEEELDLFNNLFRMLLTSMRNIVRCLMMIKELMSTTGLMTWIIRFSLSRGRFITG